MKGDPGHFGPKTMMWKVNKEITVLFGGARALLMHAAHPLIAAGARQTSFYQRDPWKRLIRTLSLQNSVTFGTKEEANDSATRINRLHEVIKGKDEITGKIYDALDHEQLLWVHACLQLSSIYFYENTVKKLSDQEKNQYHYENMLSAELVLIDIKKMPKTHEGLKKWVIEKSRENNYLLLTDVAKDVENIIAGGPVPKHIKPIWPFISFTAFQTLPPEFKEIYGIKDTRLKKFILKLNLIILKTTRPFLPPFFRLIPPARWAKQRLTRRPNLKFSEKAKI
ncbi:MAG: oxygenase MpaB family protein [Alphaproteobacteria bacterium]|tara:strand:- start:3207 stop:4049 length:843 start_codon:yes stop_codon:yes gene_type:complete